MARYFDNPFLQLSRQQANAASAYNDARVRARLLQVVADVEARQQDVLRDGDDFLYLGPGGVAYALWYVAKKLADHALLQRAQGWAQQQLQLMTQGRRHGDKDKIGFLIGHAGVHAVATVIAKDLSGEDAAQPHLAAFADIFPLAERGANDSDEMLVGRAGYLNAALWLRQQFDGRDVLPRAKLYALCDQIYASGLRYAQRQHSASPLMYAYHGTEYLGAAHGLCSILQMLYSTPGLATHFSAEQNAHLRQATDYCVGLQREDGAFPCATDEISRSGRRREDLVHWCHGAPGVIYLYARAHVYFRQAEGAASETAARFYTAAAKAADHIWEKGLLRKGPGLCHGVAGNGYAFLLMYRLSAKQQPGYLERARWFAEFMETEQFRREARTPDRPYSLYEGWAGTACFLADLLDPDKAAFPFMDVFLEN